MYSTTFPFSSSLVLDIAADVANKSKRRQHGGDRVGGGKCESCLAVVLDIFVSFGEGTERGDFLELVIRADTHLGWSP